MNLKETGNITVNLLEACSIRAPGGSAPKHERLKIKTYKQHTITRVAFELKDPKPLSLDTNFEFTIKYPNPTSAALNILRGDIGFPEISFESVDGVFYRFKRGNLKDFINFNNLEKSQTVVIPLGCFRYHKDLQCNAPDDGQFWNKSIKSIYFDILGRRETEIELELEKLLLRATAPQVPEALDLLSLSSDKSNSDLPLFVTEDARIIFRVSLNSIGRSLYPFGLRLKYTVDEGLKPKNNEVFVSTNPIYFSINIPSFGEHPLKFVLSSGGTIVAETKTSCVRTLRANKIPAMILGISDSHGYGRMNLLKPWAVRCVLPLSKCAPCGGTYRFKENYNLNPVISSSSARLKIVSLKSMPDFLRKPEPHAHRLAPRNVKQ